MNFMIRHLRSFITSSHMSMVNAELLQNRVACLPGSLAPGKHVDGVEQFRDAFKLARKAPGLLFLQEILAGFSRIPYENISKIINLSESHDWQSPRIRLPEQVMVDHIDHRLGGTCFSLTFFLQSILTQSGFTCYPVMADMRAGRNIHCCLVVLLNSTKYLVDPGYLLLQPMELIPATRRLHRTEFAGVEVRFESATQSFDLFTFNRQESKWRYRFRDCPTGPEEFLSHWLGSFQRNSMHGICLTKVQKDGVLFVNRDFMRETTFSGKRNINIKRNYHASIQEHFGIASELVEQAQEALTGNLKRKRKLGLWLPKGATTGETGP